MPPAGSSVRRRRSSTPSSPPGEPRPELIGAPYGSDLRQYAAAGIPTVQYGPGDIADAHAIEESVRIDEVVTCARAYAELIVARCG